MDSSDQTHQYGASSSLGRKNRLKTLYFFIHFHYILLYMITYVKR